jgi:hypothetical protein
MPDATVLAIYRFIADELNGTREITLLLNTSTGRLEAKSRVLIRSEDF